MNIFWEKFTAKIQFLHDKKWVWIFFLPLSSIQVRFWNVKQVFLDTSKTALMHLILQAPRLTFLKTVPAYKNQVFVNLDERLIEIKVWQINDQNEFFMMDFY